VAAFAHAAAPAVIVVLFREFNLQRLMRLPMFGRGEQARCFRMDS
jgi:hypothetical protein